MVFTNIFYVNCPTIRFKIKLIEVYRMTFGAKNTLSITVNTCGACERAGNFCFVSGGMLFHPVTPKHKFTRELFNIIRNYINKVNTFSIILIMLLRLKVRGP